MKPPSSLTGAALLEALVALGVLASAGADGQFGVLLAWRAPEAVRAAGYLAPLSVSAPSGGARLSCPERMTCQLLYSAP